MTEKETKELRKLLRIHSDLQNQIEFHEAMIRNANSMIDIILETAREMLAKEKKPLTGGKA